MQPRLVRCTFSRKSHPRPDDSGLGLFVSWLQICTASSSRSTGCCDTWDRSSLDNLNKTSQGEVCVKLGIACGAHFGVQRNLIAHDALQVVEHSNRDLALFHDQERGFTRLRAPPQHRPAAVVRPQRGKIRQLKFRTHALKEGRAQSGLQKMSRRRWMRF